MVWKGLVEASVAMRPSKAKGYVQVIQVFRTKIARWALSNAMNVVNKTATTSPPISKRDIIS